MVTSPKTAVGKNPTSRGAGKVRDVHAAVDYKHADGEGNGIGTCTRRALSALAPSAV